MIVRIPILRDWLTCRRNIFKDVGKAIGMLKIGETMDDKIIFIQETLCNISRLKFKTKKQKIQYRSLRRLVIEKNMTIIDISPLINICNHIINDPNDHDFILEFLEIKIEKLKEEAIKYFRLEYDKKLEKESYVKFVKIFKETIWVLEKYVNINSVSVWIEDLKKLKYHEKILENILKGLENN